MGSSSRPNLYLAATLLLLLSVVVESSNFLSPLLSPIFDDVCKEVECGKGTCKPSDKSVVLYECECDSGWTQTRSKNDTVLSFLPCVVPNCTMDYTCAAAAPSPIQNKSSRNNESILDPCFWTDCGGGVCNKTSAFTYNCACSEGYFNLLNVTAFPCLRDCSVGMDCMNLGISMSNRTTPPAAPALPQSASSILDKNLILMMMATLISLAMMEFIYL